jgi:two-component system phosphate regulon sensor histidine kinase PhoR
MTDTVSSAIIESMSDALLVLDFRGHVILTNPAAIRLFGLDPADIHGRTYAQIFMARPENDAFNDIVLDGVQNREVRLYREVPYMKDDGTRLNLAVTTSFLKHGQGEGETAGIVVVAKDITEAKALDRARDRVLDHLSHELRTPLSIAMGSMPLLEPTEKQSAFQRIMRNLERIEDIQIEVDRIVRKSISPEYPRFSAWAAQMLDLMDLAAEEDPAGREKITALKRRMERFFRIEHSNKSLDNPWERMPRIMETARAHAGHRHVEIEVAPEEPSDMRIDGDLLETCALTLIKNAVENTPDGGRVTVRLENLQGSVVLAVQDTGVGITAESRKQIFGGFYHARDTDHYSTKRPFDFGAGGKGLELLRLRVLSEDHAFQLGCERRRCTFLPSEKDICPGDVSRCPHIKDASECALSGSTFTVIFPPCH